MEITVKRGLRAANHWAFRNARAKATIRHVSAAAGKRRLPILSGPLRGQRFEAGINAAYTLGAAEPAVQKALQDHLRPGDVMFDIGAHVGYFTLLGSRLVGPAGRVIAFEPLPANVSRLRRNLVRCANVTVVEKAIGDERGVVELAVLSGGLAAGFARHATKDATVFVDVPVTTIDAGQLPAPSLVKIDVEGAEVEALEGMRRTLTEHRPVVLCEVHDHYQPERWPDTVRVLTDCGYTITELDDAGGMRHILATA